MGSRDKDLKDAVHGSIKLPQIIFDIIDTTQFQRLRQIKQMGGKYFVYPGASHNRFEHSIGVCYLAGEFLKALRDNHKDSNSLDITNQDILCVQIAGLCHDLGHGPFSHVFDSMVTPKLDSTWKHEDGSVLMFEYMISKNTTLKEALTTIEGLSDDDFLFIKEMILGCPLQQASSEDPTTYCYKGRTKEKWFMYEIVNNKFTSIDVDKWDYFARDCHAVGLSYDFDWKHYISCCRVLYDEDLKRKTICPMEEEVVTLYDMFHAREMLHRKVLQHVTCVSIELMIADALIAACEVLQSKFRIDIKLSLILAQEGPSVDQINLAMSNYEQFNDSILQTVVFLERQSDTCPTKVSELIQRLHSRDLYKMIGRVSECSSSHENDEWKNKAKTIKEKLKDYLYQHELTEKHFEIYIAKFDYGMQDRDPLQLLRAYKKGDKPLTAHPLTDDHEMKSRMLPREFEEKCVRLYCKDSTKTECLKKLFKEWCKENNFSDGITTANSTFNEENF